MIAYVQGTVASIGNDHAVVEVGGIGLSVLATPVTLAGLTQGESRQLPTALVVREDSLTLYGFASDDERVFFDVLQTANGVGPRLALAILATLTPEEIRRAILEEDWAGLTAVSGVGKKVAQRLVLELRGRVEASSAGISTVPSRPTTDRGNTEPWRAQLATALHGLGWATREVDDVLDALAPHAQQMVCQAGSADMSVLLREALSNLNRAEVRA